MTLICVFLADVKIFQLGSAAMYTLLCMTDHSGAS